MECLADILNKLIYAATTGKLPEGIGVIRSWVTKGDVQDLKSYNGLLQLKALSSNADNIKLLNDEIDRLKDNMSNTAKAAIEAANGGTVALDKLNKGFNWAALGAAALNFAANAAASIILSLLVTAIDKWVRRVEIAHQKTADVVSQYNEEQAAIESVTKSLDENYGKLSELRGVQLSGKWSDELEDERKQLKLQTLELERQLEVAKAKAEVTQRDVARALMNEVETTRTGDVTASWVVGTAGA